MFYALLEHWTFTHQHQCNTSELTPNFRQMRAVEAGRLGRAVEEAMLHCMGTKRRRTYGHDTVYGVPHLYLLLGKPYLGATEGKEHAHQDMKNFFRKMASKSSKTYPAVQQVLDMLVQKQHVCGAMATAVKRTHTTGMRTGLQPVPRQAKKPRDDEYIPPRHDDALEHTKHSILSRCANLCVQTADVKCLDPHTQIKLQKLEEEHKGRGGEEPFE